MSSLLFWQGRNGKSNGTTGGTNGATASSPTSNPRAWLHAPDLLLKGHVAYLVKYLGSTPVDQPKGIEVVKDAIRRLQFTQQLRKSESGAKTKKVEITISVDGVAIQEPRTSNILHQFPLHRISYCADDKEAKKYFSFIAKGEGHSPTSTNGDSNGSISNGSTNGSTSDQHECFVFVSNKLASEITLTIGQAFDLAYRRFLMEKGAGAEAVGQEAAKARAHATEMANRAKELAALLPAAELKAWLKKKGIGHPTEWNPETDAGIEKQTNGSMDNDLIQTSPIFSNDQIEDLMSTSLNTTPTKLPSVGTKLEGLLLNSDSDSDFDPRAVENDPPAVTLASRPKVSMTNPSPVQNGYTPPPLLAPPPKASKRTQNGNMNGNGFHNGTDDLFGSSPFALAPLSQAAPPQPTPQAMLSPVMNNGSSALPLAPSNTPNYNISDFSLQTSIFPPNNVPSNNQNGNAFSNNNSTSGMVGFDPFDTNKFNNFSATSNGFSNPMGFSNGFANFPFGEKQSVQLDSSFNGFLDKRVTEMKVGNF